MPKSDAELRQEMIKAVDTLFRAQVMFKGGHANLSARLQDGTMVMTRGGNVAQLNADGFAVVRIADGMPVTDIEAVNAEVIDMHAAVYRARPDVGAIIHNHAPHVTAFAVAQQPLPPVYEPLLRFGVAVPIPVVPWAPRGSHESVQGILDALEAHPGLPAVMLANHGLLAMAESPAQAAQLVITLDEAAELIIQARLLGGERPLPQKAFEQVKQRMAAFAASRT